MPAQVVPRREGPSEACAIRWLACRSPIPNHARPTLAIRSAISRKSLQRAVLDLARYSSISRWPML